MVQRPSEVPREKPRPKPVVSRDFQPAAIALEEGEPPKAVRWVFGVLALVVASAGAWASLASVDRIVVARGELVTSVPTIVVQPLERIGVKAVHVRVGDVVRRGQVLAHLDPTFAVAEVEQLQSKLGSYAARQARLEAEIAGAGYAGSGLPGSAEAAEAMLFEERSRSYAARLRSYDAELARISAAL